MTIRLLLADVDGALVTQDKVLTGEALEAARALGRTGIMLAITSGRPPAGMKMLVGPLGIVTPVAGFNGGVLTDPEFNVLETHGLDEATARRAVELIEADGLDAWLYTDTDWLIHDLSAPHVAREAWTVKFDPKVVKDYDAASLKRAIKVVGVSDDLEKVAACEKKVQDALGEAASAQRSQPYYLDVTSGLANKGQVVRTLARRLRVSPEEIATIGDQMNDTLMFAVSGFSIAMGNASDEVKARARAVTDSNEDEGFAKAVEKFILPQAPKEPAPEDPVVGASAKGASQ
ncbi:MAG: Cof-type HAD-IIB family hydrolase [Caulobacteraceae bacterium]